MTWRNNWLGAGALLACSFPFSSLLSVEAAADESMGTPKAPKIWLLNPAAIGPGMPAGNGLGAVLAKLACPNGSNGAKFCPATNSSAVASGITADGAAAEVLAIQTDETSAPLTLTVSNEATLVTYDPNYRTYPPCREARA